MISKNDETILEDIKKRHEAAQELFQKESEDKEETNELSDNSEIFSLKEFFEKHKGITMENIIGFTNEELQELTDICKNRIPASNQKSSIDLKEHIFITLLYFTWSKSIRKLATFIGIKKSTIDDVLKRTYRNCLPIWISEYLPQQIIPTKNHFINYPECVGAIDTTTIPINRPTHDLNLMKQTWDAKNKKNGYKLEALVNPDGIAIFARAGIPAAEHDLSIVKSTKLVEFLTYQSGITTKVHKILGDRGYIGLQKLIPETPIMLKKNNKRKN